MECLFCDRLTGNTDSLPESQHTLMGRWLIMPSQKVGTFLNSVPVSRGDFLVPELSGNWRLLEQDGTLLQGSVLRGQLPEDIEQDSIRTIGNHLNSMMSQGATWLEWLDVVPLVPGMSEAAELHHLDKMIRKHFGHLEAVCLKPRAYLHVEIERVAVAKARRLPIKAASYLASHTEDWERPLLKGVLPKNILSEVRDDQVDIYENRVAARLIDHLSVYLGRRIQVIGKLLKVFKDKEDYSRNAGGTYLRSRRILSLWGQSIDTNEGRRKATTTLKELEWLKYKVMGLMGSPLYEEVPRRTYVSPTLRTTNILTNDQHYRRVAELWREWVGAGHARTKIPLDVHQEAQDLCHGLDRFSLLIVMRALDQLGYQPTEPDLEKSVKAPGRWTLEGHGTRLDCVWDEDGKIRIEISGRKITFVSLAMDLQGTSNDEQLMGILDRFVDAAAKSNGRLMVLYPASSDEMHSTISPTTHRKLHTVGNDPHIGLPDSVGILPISPWDISSTERIARGVRWFLDSARFKTYPCIIELTREARRSCDNLVSNGWLELSADGSRFIMRRTPKVFEYEQLGLERLVDDARGNLYQARIEHERLSGELREAVRRGKTGTLNQQKTAANQRCVDMENRLVAVKKLHDDLQEARRKSDALLMCPACGTVVDPVQDFHPRDKGCFRCDCQGCRSWWATRLCSKGHKYAVMLPGDFVDTEDTSPGWEDRLYGSDLLGLPAKKQDGSWGFLCPDCGDVT